MSAEDIPTGEKPTGEKPTGEKPTGEKPAGDESTRKGFEGEINGRGIDRKGRLLIGEYDIIFLNNYDCNACSLKK